MKEKAFEQHNTEIQKNLTYWENKPLLKKIYQGFYQIISQNISRSVEGKIVELGSGIGNIKIEIPDAICTDIFKNPWIDQVENAYKLTFRDNSVSNIILFDVFHHIQYPGNALDEFKRVLKPGGRVIIFEPSIGLLGFLVYGLFHHEPISFMKKINWNAPKGFDPWLTGYYAAQGNSDRIFFGTGFYDKLNDWDLLKKCKYSSLAYVLSGGYSRPQLYPLKHYSFIKRIEKTLDHFPALFSTRSLVVLRRK